MQNRDASPANRGTPSRIRPLLAAAITALVILLGPLTGTAVVAYALIVLVLTLAYGWKGVALSLAFYVAVSGHYPEVV